MTTIPAAAPVTRLTVLHDPGCLLCRHLTGWLQAQPKLLPVDLVVVGSPAARRRFPGLDHDASLGELTVVADTGEVWRGAPAFVTALWALADHRALAVSLATPAGLPMARAAALAASAYRRATGAAVPPGPAGGGAVGPADDRSGGSLGGPACDDDSCPLPGTPSG
ncbi:hypothetical protein ACIRBX_08860 [Kitasatospora sp. NPDC096147]|uniref:hypothetical protein n=1 Tax=Kitasatospora sp. NPDC096147 TaxID=3364093 RepID=UPI0037F4740E